MNVYPSLLPKYRGSAPIQWSILNGDTETGVTIMYLNEKMDEGDIILQEKVKIDENETTGELWNRLSKIGARMLEEAINKIEDGTAARIKQGSEFSIAPMLEKEMSKINWNEKTAKQIKNLVRGLNPIMGTYTFLNNKKIKFWKVDVVNKIEGIDNTQKFELGEVILSDSKKGLYIKAIDGIIKVLEIQGENAKRMNIGDFLRGNAIEIGSKFI